MKLSVTFISLLLCNSCLFAQESAKKIQVKISKVEIVNGKEVRFDTSYTTTNLTELESRQGLDMLPNTPGMTRIVSKIIQNSDSIVLSDEITDEFEVRDIGSGNEKQKIMTLQINDNLSEQQISQLRLNLHDIQIPGDTMMGKTIMIKKIGKCDASPEEIKNAKIDYYITVNAKTQLFELTPTESAQFAKQGITSENNLLFAKEVVVSPNPSSGKFNLRFELKNTGPLTIEILSEKGEAVYLEKLPEFNGVYNKDINTSNFSKGIHLIRITQGSNSCVKKLVVN